MNREILHNEIRKTHFFDSRPPVYWVDRLRTPNRETKLKQIVPGLRKGLN